MNFSSFLLMRQEIILLTIILILVAAEIAISKTKKHSVVHLAIFLFGIHTIVGFFAMDSSSLFGGMFRTSGLIHFFKNVLNVGVLILLLQSADWLQEKIVLQNRGTEFFILLFSSLLGMYFMISAGDFLMFYLGLELSTLPVAALAAFEVTKRISSEAGIKFILSAALASGVSLFGISMLYSTSGSIYFDDIIKMISSTNLTLLGFILFFAGLAFKISLVPFHFWTADVYEGAPISVASYLSVISKGAAVFILMILLFTVFKTLIHVWENIIYVVALATMFIGNLFALRQQNMKRFLAFSSIAQAGFILLGLITGTQLGTATIIYFVMIYIFSNLAAFGVVQAISLKTGKENMNDYEGLYRTNPNLSLVMMLALFSLAGIPPVAGFFGKFFLFTAAASEGYYLLVFLAVVNVTISLYYYLLVVRAMFLRTNDQAIPYFKNKLYMRLGLLVTVVGILVIGLYSPLYDYIFELSKNLN
ncbi:MAG: NADH-quinone oxidoreductase subunit N [Flavobacteriales bacterium]|nr:NADH-quinone oxidoreductase subunit N [Flavobacteriia bacterium]NCP05861.1 NADH-quinone oxidoreductase subunit N [Flavobacteriales bacterium]PIV93210.1 MAG: NADH-quinone oxidoreductase subunit N [Flavobacteriaceae bacterium CG17_big_fil_post_rev_8_21_14_2_50_33_15]PIY12848.1 MAG: NADH-quinone oxidoreductase subunit N [Flavobacteriaceae bacterium CG_4_10_14_3_um_filter_33_47]PJB19991.1 MAG: NADH-quinone oxidoreductase subunit N [Flavobacteriaceae bacterium CG_4_9_14_3_um_filter_33_16]